MKRKIILASSIAVLTSFTLSMTPNLASAETVTTLVVPVNQSPWTNAYKAIVAEYTKQTGIQIDLRVFPYDELRTQVVNDIKSGKHTYDVYQMDEVFLHEFYDNGWLQPLKQVNPTFKMDPAIGSYAAHSYWNPTSKTSDPKGTAMSLPLNGNVQLFMYRKDIYQALGLTVPKTWDDVLANGKKIMSANAAKYGYVIRTQGVSSGSAVTYDFQSIFYSYGASLFNKEGSDWTPAVDSPQAVAAATMFRNLVKLGPEATSTIGQAQVISALQRGDAAQGQLVAAAAASMSDPNSSLVVGKIGFAPMPAGPVGSTPTSGTWGLGIPTGIDSTRAKAAYDFINWVLSKKTQLMFAEAGGIPTRTDVIPNANLTASQKDYLSAVQSSLLNVRPGVRYVFALPLLAATEQRLAAIAAGTVSPKDGMQKLYYDLAKVVSDYSYAMVKKEARAATVKKITITCVKGKVQKKVTGSSPKCPKGYKKK